MKNKLILLCFILTASLSIIELKAQSKQDTIIREYYKAFDAGDFDKVISYFSIDAKISVPFVPGLMGITTYKQMAIEFKRGFPDIKHTVLESFEKKNDYAFKALMIGTNTGESNGNKPTGNKIESPFAGLIRFNSEGKITNMSIYMDTKSFLEQLNKGAN